MQEKLRNIKTNIDVMHGMNKLRMKGFTKYFNKYITWNLMYSVFAILSIIFGIAFASVNNPNLSAIVQFDSFWFFMFWAGFIIWMMVSFIVNACYSIYMFKIHKGNLTKTLILCASLIIPFVGCVSEWISRSYEEELAIGLDKVRKQKE